MKVKELLEKLEQLDPEMDVLCSSEDSDIQSPNHLFKLFDILSIEAADAEKCKGEDEMPSLKYGKSPVSEKHAIIEITSVF